jgi:HEAT repeat protein
VDFATAKDTQGDRTSIEEESIDNLVVMTGNQDPQLRIHALAALSEGGLADESTVRSALNAALDDKNANVRAYAVQALAGRGGPEAAAILGQALRDPDPNVRIMAVDQMVPKDQGLTLLQEALADTNETVRTIAAERLKQEPKEAGTE